MIAGGKKPLITLFCSGLSSISGPEVEGVLGNLVTVTCVARGEIQVIRKKISDSSLRCIFVHIKIYFEERFVCFL